MPVDLKKYPRDWKVRSRFVRLVRSRGCCEWCGAKNYLPHPETGSKVVLTTAHVFNKSPMVANLLNLAALCQRCHLRHDARDHVAARLSRRAAQINFDAPKTLIECVKFCAWQSPIPMKSIARMMGITPSVLSRKLSGVDASCKFSLDDLELFVAVTGDKRPIQYLAEKYLVSGDANRIAALEAELALLKGKGGAHANRRR